MESRGTRVALGVWSALLVLFLWLPLLVICIYAFNSSNIQSWPISGWSVHWFRQAWHDTQLRDSFWLSVRVALLAAGIALLLGTMAAFAIHRFRFFGR